MNLNLKDLSHDKLIELIESLILEVNYLKGLAPDFPKIFTKVGITLIKSMDRTSLTILPIFYVF